MYGKRVRNTLQKCDVKIESEIPWEGVTSMFKNILGTIQKEYGKNRFLQREIWQLQVDFVCDDIFLDFSGRH